MKFYLQILLLLGISLGYLVNADIQCSSKWLSEGYTNDPCYSCKEDYELQSWCASFLNGENPEELPCCSSDLLGSDFADIMPTDDEYYSDDYEYYSDLDSDEELFAGSDLSGDEFAGRITNDEVLLPLPSSLEEFDSITITPPSLVDFTAPPDCSLASILGNNYVDSYRLTQQKCIRDLKEQLRLDFTSFQNQVSETKANFETFLQEFSSKLSADEIVEVQSQMADLDAQVVEKSERMRAQLRNPDCTKYTDIVKDESIIQAADSYDRVLDEDEMQAQKDLFCLENYIRRLQSSLEECQYEITNLYGPLVTEANTEFIYEKMCSSRDVQRVQDITNEFFAEIGYESTYPTPVVEPMEYIDEPDDTAEQLEQRRVEITKELGQLQQELDQAAMNKQIIYTNLVEVANRRVYVEERINQLQESEIFDSDEGTQLSNELMVLLSDESNLKSELAIINELISEIETDMNDLLAEEIQLEIQLGVLPEEQTSSPIDDFVSILGPGPVQLQEVPTETDEESADNTEGVTYDKYPTEAPEQEVIINDILMIEPEEGEKHGRLSNYLIVVLVGVVLMIGILMTSLCIIVCVLMNKKKVKKVYYDKASLSGKDPALLLKQTGFENPTYKFYVQNSKRNK